MFSVILHKRIFKEWLKIEIVRISVVLRTQKRANKNWYPGGIYKNYPPGTTQLSDVPQNKKRGLLYEIWSWISFESFKTLW